MKNMKYQFLWHNFVSDIIRTQISLFRMIMGKDSLIPIIPLRFYMWRELVQWGPSFHYKGDELVWSWKGRTWTSTLSSGTFMTLYDVDVFWKEYKDHCD